MSAETPSPPAKRFLLPHTTPRRRRLEAVRKGNAAVGVRGTDTVVLGIKKKSTPKLEDSRSVRKIASLDTHVALACAGFKADRPALYQTDPSGTFSAWKANAMGRNTNSMREFHGEELPAPLRLVPITPMRAPSRMRSRAAASSPRGHTLSLAP
ncbi:hypothetical protein ZWY2020_057465 [Hordeum vulgare]|nr:hypothetical protein ZWY2020_057465 [Hordeum vulgare]